MGIRPEVAQSVVELGADLSGVITRGPYAMALPKRCVSRVCKPVAYATKEKHSSVVVSIYH